MMRAEYDSEADALAIDLVEGAFADVGEELGDRCVVALDDAGRAVSVEVLFPGDDLDAMLWAAAERFGLDAEGLRAAARAALAAPDRAVTMEVAGRAG